MPVFTTVRIADPFGVHLIEVANYTRLDYVLNTSPGAIGVLELTLPSSFDTSLLIPDGRIGVWRSIGGAPPVLDGHAIYLIREFEYTDAGTFVRAFHATSLLARRIIAYSAGTAYTDKTTAAADNQIKAFWRENAGSSINASLRDGTETQADISTYVSVQANLGQGASVAKTAARRNLLDVCTELAEASADAGTYLTFEIMAPTESTLELRTYATVRGVDRRIGTASPVVLSEARGNMESSKLNVSYRDEATFAVAGGSGEKTARLIATTLDTTRLTASPFGRKEIFLDMSNVDNGTTLQHEANAAVWNARQITTFTANLIETPATIRGIHFDVGDIVTAENPYASRLFRSFDMRLEMIRETIDQSGHVTQCALRSVS